MLECLWTHRQVFEALLEARERQTGVAEDLIILIENDILRPKLEAGSFLAPLVAACAASEPEQPFSDVSKLAKGPDGTTGFLRTRTIKPFGFSAEVAEFVPSFSLPAGEPPGSNIY